MVAASWKLAAMPPSFALTAAPQTPSSSSSALLLPRPPPPQVRSSPSLSTSSSSSSSAAVAVAASVGAVWVGCFGAAAAAATAVAAVVGGAAKRRFQARGAHPRHRAAGLVARCAGAGGIVAQGPEMLARTFIVKDEDSKACPASDVALGVLLQWCKMQPSLMIHPGIVAGTGCLKTSMPVLKGTPLIGVRPAAYLSERPVPGGGDSALSDAAREELLGAFQRPESWPFRLALRMHEEARNPSSPWQRYLASLAPRPAAPFLWSMQQVIELQYIPVKRAIRDQLQEVRAFHCQVATAGLCEGSDEDLLSIGCLVASAAAGGIRIQPDAWATMPLIDLVGPPEMAVTDEMVFGHLAREPSCLLEVEGDLEDGSVVLFAARDLSPGEVLTRDLGLPADETLLRYGLCPSRGHPGDSCVVWAGVDRDNMEGWRIVEFKRAMKREVEAGVDANKLFVEARIRPGKTLAEAVDKTLVHAARVLSCKTEDAFYGGKEWARNEKPGESKGLRGLKGLSTEYRRNTLTALSDLLKGAVAAFETSIVEDQQIFPRAQRHHRVAIAYRLGKKRLINEVEGVVSDTQDREMQNRRSIQVLKGLPAAVTGKPTPKSTKGEGFDSGSSRPSLSAEEAGGRRPRETRKEIAQGSRVQVLAGVHAGKQGRAVTRPSALGFFELRLDDGPILSNVATEICTVVV